MNILMQRNGQDHTMQLSQHLGGVICVKVKTKKGYFNDVWNEIIGII